MQELEDNSENLDPKQITDHYMNFQVTDQYLLEYLLNKYRIDKQKLIQSIRKEKENYLKSLILCDFYDDCENIHNKTIKEQYQLFKKWNKSGVDISKEEIDNYYEKNFSDL